jgi:hypothetical protein
MGSIDLQITALQNVSPAQVAEVAPAPAAQPTSEIPATNKIPEASVPKAQQDTVSLSGTRPPQQRQQNAQSSGNAQPATFALLAHTITFPPSQNSTPAFTTSAFPPAATAPPGQNQGSAVIAATPNTAATSVIAASAAQATATNQTPIATAAASAEATATPTSAPSTAPPQQTLQQLDRVLQQLGIDPQSLSLISREGMLNWVNDPAALRQIVQNVQSAANSSQANAAVGAANPTSIATELSSSSANQNPVQPPTPNQPQAPAEQTNPTSDNSPVADSANSNASNQSAATAQQNATAVMQFQQLQDSFAPDGGQPSPPAANPADPTTPQGRHLNVSA